MYPFVPMTERQAFYCTDQAKDLRDRAAVAKRNLGQVEEQLGRCLDALSRSDPDLDGIEKRLASMARMLRDTADQLDGQ
jgi:ABC-type transporter Mla subunit MlaD